MGRGSTRHMAPSQTRQDPIESLFMHCDLAADAQMVGNVRNCLLHAVPAEGRHGQVVCYEPQQLDWLPVCWTEFQKVLFEDGTCAVKLLLRRRGGYFRLWDTSTEALTSSWWPRPSRCSPGLGTSEDMASGISSKDCSVWPSLCSKALCWGLVCAWPAMCSEERPWHRPSRTTSPPWQVTWCRQPRPNPPESVPLRPDEGRPRGKCLLKGIPWNAKETSLADKGDGPIGHVLTRTPAVLAGCHSRPTRNSPACLAPRVN